MYSPLRRSAGALSAGSGSDSGSGGETTLGGLGGANDFGPNGGPAWAMTGSAPGGRRVPIGAVGGERPLSSSPDRLNAFATTRDARAAMLSSFAPASSGRVSRSLAGLTACAAAGTATFGSGGASVEAAFFVCFAMTSRRCFSRRRSSRHSWNASTLRVALRCIAPSSEAKNRPKENCVDMMIARKISVTRTMSEPVRFRYSDIRLARNSPA